MPGHSSADCSVLRFLKALVLVAAEQVFHDRRRVGNEAGLDLPQVQSVACLTLQPSDQGGLAVSPQAVKQYDRGIPFPCPKAAYQDAQMVFPFVPIRPVRKGGGLPNPGLSGLSGNVAALDFLMKRTTFSNQGSPSRKDERCR